MNFSKSKSSFLKSERELRMAVGNKKRKSTSGSKILANGKKIKKAVTIDPLQRLNKIIGNSYYITLKGKVPNEVLDLLKNVVGIRKFDMKEKVDGGLFLAFNVNINEEKKSEGLGVIIGPNTVSEPEEIPEFYKTWGGKKFCALRRFPDGSTHETVALHNPGGLIYMPMAKINHLIQLHAPTVELECHNFHEDFRQQILRTHQDFLLHRQKVDEFCGQIRLLSDELPIRKIQPLHSSLYKGVASNHCQLSEIHSTDHSSSKVVFNAGQSDGILQIQESSKIAPSKLNALKIILDISEKHQMSSEMFARLKCAYVMKLQEKLLQPTMLKSNSELLVIDNEVVYQICIKAPNDQHHFQSQVLLQDKLASVGLQHIIYPALCQIVHQWLATQYLSMIIDEVLIDVIIAAILSSQYDESKEPITIENGFLTFLHWCSFTDFTKTALVFGSKSKNEELDKAQYDFKVHREKYPFLTLFVTDVDLDSKISQGLDNKVLQRLINCARGTLHQLSTHMEFDSLLNDAFEVNDKVFDALITLKPFQVPVKSKSSGKFKKEAYVDFPIVDYDPLQRFWLEIHSSFAQECQFYLNSRALKIGIKFSSNVSNTKMILEDIQVLGKDFIKECILKK